MNPKIRFERQSLVATCTALLILGSLVAMACNTKTTPNVEVDPTEVTSTPALRFTQPESCSEALDLIIGLDPYVYQRFESHAEFGATEDVLADDEFLLQQLWVAESYFDDHCD